MAGILSKSRVSLAQRERGRVTIRSLSPVRSEATQSSLSPVRGLDENLGLALLDDAALHLFQLCSALGLVDGQVAVEGEALAVESRAHQGQQDA